MIKIRECAHCGSTKNITKHHVLEWIERRKNGQEGSFKIYLCQECHDMIHGIQRKEDKKSLKRRIRRAKRRIKRDSRIIEQTEKQLLECDEEKVKQ